MTTATFLLCFLLMMVSWRHCKHAKLSIEGFLWVWRYRCGRQQL
jgi:hypothetical protein